VSPRPEVGDPGCAAPGCTPLSSRKSDGDESAPSSLADVPLELAGVVVVLADPPSPDLAAAMPIMAVKNEATAAMATTFFVRSPDVRGAVARGAGSSGTRRAVGSASIGS